MARSAVLVALGALLAACTDAATPVDSLQTAQPEFEVFLEVDATGAVELDGVPLEHELESRENYARLRSAGARRVGHFDASDPTSCILPLVRVRLSVDPVAPFGRVRSLLAAVNQQGVHIWDVSLAAPSYSGGGVVEPPLPLPLRACEISHSPPEPWSLERCLIVVLTESKQLAGGRSDFSRGWRLQKCDYLIAPDPRSDLEWSEVLRVVAEARAQTRTTLLSRAVPSQAPWHEVLPLLEQLHGLGVDHYVFDDVE